jgi:hypothetical protein
MILLKEATDFNDFQILTEERNGKKELYIKGIFAQSEVKNRNGRFYPKSIMESAVSKYNTDWVLKNRAMGELSHPENRPMVKPEFASHLITSFEMNGPNVIGKARILNTPQGQVVKGLLEGGVQLGVSTRGLGSLVERMGAKYVQNDFMLTAVDIVSDPSSPDAWVNSINENKEWVYLDGKYVEQDILRVKKFINESTVKKLNEKRLELFQDFLNKISM